jgi:hypothetical protein
MMDNPDQSQSEKAAQPARPLPFNENPEPGERPPHVPLGGGLSVTAGGAAPLSDTPMRTPPANDPYELENDDYDCAIDGHCNHKGCIAHHDMCCYCGEPMENWNFG